MAKSIEIKLKVKQKWWFKYLYWPGLTFMNWFVVSFINIEAEPNWDKVHKVIEKGITFHIIK